MHKLIATALVMTAAFCGESWAGVTTYTTEADWATAVANNYVTEPFNAGGLQSFTGVTTDAGSIGSASGLLTGSVWSDRVVTGGASTTFSYIPGALLGAGATWDTSPGGEGQGLQLTLNLVGGGTESRGSDWSDRQLVLWLCFDRPVHVVHDFGRYQYGRRRDV